MDKVEMLLCRMEELEEGNKRLQERLEGMDREQGLRGEFVSEGCRRSNWVSTGFCCGPCKFRVWSMGIEEREGK